jgi:hypothetical protein
VDYYYCHLYSQQAGHQLLICYSIIHEIFSITKSVQSECQKQCRDKYKCACNFCSNVMKERLSCNRLSMVTKPRCTNGMSLPRTKKFKSVSSDSKVVLTMFCNFNGPILEHYQDHGQRVNSTQYCATLE